MVERLVSAADPVVPASGPLKALAIASLQANGEPISFPGFAWIDLSMSNVSTPAGVRVSFILANHR